MNGPAGTSRRRSLALSLILALRPGQWTKNGLVFAALPFAVKLFDVSSVIRSVEAFVIFCALSGVVYLVNDVGDRESDRRHPLKRLRPVASGDLPIPVAIAASVIIAVAAITAAFALGWRFGAIALSYLVLLTLYSAALKHMVILDVLTIAVGFVLRAVAGAVVIDVVISHWLLVCTILLALFIALAKRRHELVLLADGASGHRPILGEYSAYLLDQMIGVVTASTLIAYIFYTISPETEQKFGTSWLGLTIPFPLYGIFRYLYLIHQRDGGGSPADLLLNDRPLLACVTLWGVAVVLIIYRPFFALTMSDFTVRADAVNVEQIMEQIRARIREKRGVDYTEQQIQDMAAVKLEKFLDPRGVRSDLLDQFRRARPAYAPPDLPNYAFEEGTLFESHRGPLRAMRRLLRPLLKLFFNPNPLIQALNIQSRLNAAYAEREARREAERHAFDQLYYEVVHNLVTETTRLGIEVKNLKMRVESLTSRLEFNERRSRALESVVVYREPAENHREESAPPAAAGTPPVAAREAGPGEINRPASPGGAPAEGPGQRSRRRRRRRGRRGTGSVATMMGAQQAGGTPQPPGPSAGGSVADEDIAATDSAEPEQDASEGFDAGDSEPSDPEQ